MMAMAEVLAPALLVATTSFAVIGTIVSVFGSGLMLVLMGVVIVLGVIAGYLYPRLRLIEIELPDALPDAPAQEETAHPEQISNAIEAATPTYRDRNTTAKTVGSAAASTDF